jgi:hypothetical protein
MGYLATLDLCSEPVAGTDRKLLVAALREVVLARFWPVC